MCRCQILTVLLQNLLGKAGANPPARLSKSPFTNMFQYVVYTFLHCNLKRSFPFSAAANNAIGSLQLTHNAQHSAIVSSLHISSTCSLEVDRRDVLSDCSVWDSLGFLLQTGFSSSMVITSLTSPKSHQPGACAWVCSPLLLELACRLCSTGAKALLMAPLTAFWILSAKSSAFLDGPAPGHPCDMMTSELAESSRERVPN